jgi:hypothetical protein
MKHLLAAAAALLLAAAPARAQTDDDAPPRVQSISILPFHFLIGFYAGDYERAMSNTLTLGLGASYFSMDGAETYDPYTSEPTGSYDSDFRYGTVEGKLRYYPSGDVLNGMSFGVTFGPTFVTGDGASPNRDDNFTAMGVGFEIARSQSLGVDRSFYYGYGGGAKRLFPIGAASGDAEKVLPTLRLSVGILF